VEASGLFFLSRPCAAHPPTVLRGLLYSFCNLLPAACNEDIPSVTRNPSRHHPHYACARRNHPLTRHPHVAAAVPSPIPSGPHVLWARRPANYHHRLRCRWRDFHHCRGAISDGSKLQQANKDQPCFKRSRGHVLSLEKCLPLRGPILLSLVSAAVHNHRQGSATVWYRRL